MRLAKLSEKYPAHRSNSHWSNGVTWPPCCKGSWKQSFSTLTQSKLGFLNKTECIVTKQLAIPATWFITLVETKSYEKQLAQSN